MAKGKKAADAAVEDVPAEIDVDTLSDEDFDKLKADMASPAEIDQQTTETATREQMDAEAEAEAKAAEEAAAAEAAEAASEVVETETVETEPAPAKDQPAKTVPHGAFHQERELRKQREKELQEEREKRIRIEERTKALLDLAQQQQKPAEPEKKPPSREDDPFAYLEYVEQNLNRLDTALQDRQKVDAENDAWRQAYTTYNADLRRFASEHPELPQAIEFLATTRRQELALFGLTDPVAQSQDLESTERQIIAYALQNGRSPAEMLYQMAVQRGFKLPDAPATNGSGSQVTETVDDGDHTTNGVTKPDPKAIIAKVDKQEKTKTQAKTLGGSGAPVDMGEVGPADILEMDDEQFAAFKKKFGEKAMRRVFVE